MIGKFIYSFFEYLPTKYIANGKEWAVRNIIWDFKAGKRSEHIAKMVANKMIEQFGAKCKDITFACVPASSSAKNLIRYKSFAAKVAELTGCKNAFDAISIEGGRLAIHESKRGKRVETVEIINFDKDFFKGQRVLVFDDVITKGVSYQNFASVLENLGASILGGYFLGKTILR